jgi:hypothetical protein
MEDVLEVYCRPYDPARPQVNLDAAAKQLLAEVRAPLPMRPGAAERVDGEYKREGTAAIFMVCLAAGRTPPRPRARATHPPGLCGGDQDALR